jgi:hypothetical protein
MPTIDRREAAIVYGRDGWGVKRRVHYVSSRFTFWTGFPALGPFATCEEATEAARKWAGSPQRRDAIGQPAA